jgi:GTP-binding protein
MRTIESINRASLVLLIIDAGEPVSNQDKKIAEYAHRNYKDIIVVFNKWDLPQKDSKTTKRFTDEFRYEMPFLEHAPVAFVSARSRVSGCASCSTSSSRWTPRAASAFPQPN